MTREELNQIKLGKTVIRINSTGEEILVTGWNETRGGKQTYVFADGRNWQPSTLLKRCSIVTFGVEETQELSDRAKRMLSVIKDQKRVDISTEQFEYDCNTYKDHIDQYINELVDAGEIILNGSIATIAAEEIESKKQFVEDVLDEVVLLLPEGCEMVYENKRYDIEQYNDMIDTTENILNYIKGKTKVLLVNKVLDELERMGHTLNCVLDVDAFGKFEEGELQEVHDDEYYHKEIINLLKSNMFEFVKQAIDKLPSGYNITFDGRYSLIKGKLSLNDTNTSPYHLFASESRIEGANNLLDELEKLGVLYPMIDEDLI